MDKLQVGINPNVYVVDPVDGVEYVLRPNLEALLNQVAPLNPTFGFLVNVRPCGYCGRVDIYCGGVSLGAIWASTRGYALRGPRVDASLTRGHMRRTNNLSKAVKMFREYYRPDTPAEKKEKVRTSISAAIYKSLTKRAEVEREFVELLRNAHDHILKNGWDIITPLLLAANLSSAQRVKELPQQHAEATLVEKFDINHREGLGVIVFIHDGVCYASRMGTKKVPVPISPTPAGLKEALGVLKLVEDNTFVDNYGLRLSENEFYLLGGEDEIPREV